MHATKDIGVVPNESYGSFVFLVDLDGLVGFSCQQAAAALVKGGHKDPGLTVQGAWLHCRLQLLEVVAGLPVPEVQAAIVS